MFTGLEGKDYYERLRLLNLWTLLESRNRHCNNTVAVLNNHYVNVKTKKDSLLYNYSVLYTFLHHTECSTRYCRVQHMCPSNYNYLCTEKSTNE